MSVISTADPQFQDALDAAVVALRRIADFELDPSFDQHLQQFGERKEFLNPAEHAELLALVAFTQQRTREKLEARLALQRLHSLFPDLVDAA